MDRPARQIGAGRGIIIHSLKKGVSVHAVKSGLAEGSTS
jgi:hypothetical protein